MFYLIIILFEDVSEGKLFSQVNQLHEDWFRSTLERNR